MTADTTTTEPQLGILGELFEQAPVFVALLRGPDHVFTLTNALYRRTVGRDDLLGKPVREALPDLAGQGFFELLDQVYRTGESFVGTELPLAFAGDPATRYVTFVYQATRASDGSVSGIGVFGFEETAHVLERERAAVLAREREFALEVLERGEPLVVLDADWRITMVNEPYERMAQRPSASLVGHDFWTLFPEVAHEGSTHRVAFTSARDTKQPVRVEVYYEPLDLWTQLSIFPSSRGGIAIFCRDTSEDKRLAAERARLAGVNAFQTAELEAIFASLPDAVVVADHEGVRRANRAAYTLLGVAPGHAPESTSPSSADAPTESVHRSLQQALGGEASVFEGAYEGPAGSLMVRSAAAPIRVDGRIAGAVAIVSDMTGAHQALLREQAARQDADVANRLKDDFLATVSHELRTPLNAMVGWTSLLRGGKLDEAKRVHALDVIERNARSQVQLIEDLLDISRIISGKLRLTVVPVDVHAVVEAAMEVVQPAADAKGVRLAAVLDPDAGVISGDADRLQQIIWNLLSNAVKFTPRGGRVRVRLARVDSSVEVVVSDSGRGIEADFLPHVFDRFRQAEGVTTRSFGGLGLGLAIVKNLVELHGGTVTAASEGTGHGAEFSVRLPVAPVRSAPLDPAHAARLARSTSHEIDCPPQLDGLRVLVVDDEPDARELLREVLRHCGVNVQVAPDAATALAMFRADPPDAMVSDIGMPLEDGYSLIRKIRALSPAEGGRTPVIALTAYARAEDRTRALLAGFTMHVSKPIDPGELLVVLGSVVQRA